MFYLVSGTKEKNSTIIHLFRNSYEASHPSCVYLFIFWLGLKNVKRKGISSRRSVSGPHIYRNDF